MESFDSHNEQLQTSINYVSGHLLPSFFVLFVSGFALTQRLTNSVRAFKKNHNNLKERFLPVV